MKKLLILLFISCCFIDSFGNHLKGGFFTYEYLGPGQNNPTFLRYRVRLTIYMDCIAMGGQINNPINFSFFDAGTNQLFQNVSVPISQQYDLHKGHDNPCINGNQAQCYYKIVVYNLPSIELPPNQAGYTVSYQRCCRIAGINNIAGNSNSVGNTYSITIPGGANQQNSSAVFAVNDTAVVCANSSIQIPFSATDPNSDSLSYFFCAAWDGADQNVPAPNTANAPPYGTIPYATGFSGAFPLGNQVTINPVTGLISGIAPAPGEYVITVCVNEYKNGVLIATTRKELHVKVGDCDVVDATLPASFPVCDNFTQFFQNLSPANSLVTGYLWSFGDNTTSTQATPTHTYSDTGTYRVKLIVNPGGECQDSAFALAYVYPGFFPGFTINGICVNKPTQFLDTTRTLYGFVNSWRWNFGDATTNADTSRLQNPVYTYGQTGVKNVRFIVTSNKGCIDTVDKDITIMDKPPLNVQPRDTLICNGATVQLGAIGNGNFSWTGPNIISNGNTASPTVAPNTTSNYYVTLDDQGCINTDSMRVRVVNFVTLQAMQDTTICATDSVRLRVSSNGLHYAWTNASTLNNPNSANPTALPTSTPTTYQVTARIDHCIATDDVTVTLVPYPVANAGPDTTICYDTDGQLRGSMVGSSFTWTPASTLTNANTLNPLASPLDTTAYVLSVTDILGCPKPRRDTVIVYVLPKILAFAGKDTAVVVGQQLQFNASGGVSYFWTPATGLNRTDIPNPMGVYNGSQDSIRYKVVMSNTAGCLDSAYVTVRVFRTNPQIFVPTAFTPNGDGKNDYVRPIPVGITHMDYFRIYNRWGQLVYSSTDTEGPGWDGKIKGKEQATATFVWIVRGTDFTGKVVFAKGTVTLIR